MSGLVETTLTAALAAVACLSWVVSTRRGDRAMTNRQLALLAGWAGLRGAGHLLAGLPVSPWWSVSALGAAALLALGGAVLAVALVPTPGGPPRLLAEGTLIATSLTAVAWAAADGVPVLAPDCYGRLAIAIADIAVLALIVRLGAGAPHLLTDRRQLPAMVLSGGAVLALTVADGLPLLTYRPPPAGQPLPPLPDGAMVGPHWALAAAGLGYLLAAIVPWVTPRGRAEPGEPPTAALRSAPYLLVVAAVLAVSVRSVRTAAGPVLVLLIALVIAALVALLVVALRENGRLVGEVSLSRDSLEALVENTGDVIVRLDAAGRVLSANAATERLLGRRPAELLGRPLAELAEAGRRDRVAAAIAGVAGGRATAAQVEFELAAPAGGIADLRLRAMAEGAIGNLHDVTDAVALRRSLERMARYDEMTGLANRAHVVEVVTAWLAEVGGPVAVVSGDLNGFKAVNDRFGHPAGDQVLREIADRLRDLVRPLPGQCLVGRIGGDEFVVAVRDLDDAGVTALALRLGAATTPSFRVGERTLGLAISVGVACARPGDGVDASTLLHRASLAMFDAKAEGLDEVTRWAPHLEERAQRRVDIAIGLRSALDDALDSSLGRCGLTLAYQPLVRLPDGLVIGAEALIRVPPQTPDGPFAGLEGLVTPAEIVEVAEDTGVIIELGHWVLIEATRQAAQWRLDGHDILIGVNMSVRQLAASGFADTVLAAMAAAGLPRTGCSWRSPRAGCWARAARRCPPWSGSGRPA